MIAIGPGSVEPLLEGLGGSPIYVKKRIIYSLGRIADRRATKPLLQYLAAEDLELRGFAFDALANIGDPAAIPNLRTLYHQYVQSQDSVWAEQTKNTLIAICAKNNIPLDL